MKRILILLAAVCLAGCGGPSAPLVVKSFLLRDQERDPGEEPMVRMEKERRLRGAVTMDERRQRLGQYYTLLWKDPQGVNQGEVELVFEYRQGASASRVKRMQHHFPASAANGKAEFAVIGDDYFKNGRVLAWQVTLRRGGRIVASERSYLWN